MILTKSLRPHLKLSHRRLDGNAGNGGAIGRPMGLAVGGFLGDVLAGCRKGEHPQTQQSDAPGFGAMLGFHGSCNYMSENVNTYLRVVKIDRLINLFVGHVKHHQIFRKPYFCNMRHQLIAKLVDFLKHQPLIPYFQDAAAEELKL